MGHLGLTEKNNFGLIIRTFWVWFYHVFRGEKKLRFFLKTLSKKLQPFNMFFCVYTAYIALYNLKMLRSKMKVPLIFDITHAKKVLQIRICDEENPILTLSPNSILSIRIWKYFFLVWKGWKLVLIGQKLNCTNLVQIFTKHVVNLKDTFLDIIHKFLIQKCYFWTSPKTKVLPNCMPIFLENSFFDFFNLCF